MFRINWKRLVLDSYFADMFAGNDELHDGCSSITDLQTGYVAHALLVWGVFCPAVVTQRQDALVDDIERIARTHPFAHGRFSHMGLARIA